MKIPDILYRMTKLTLFFAILSFGIGIIESL